MKAACLVVLTMVGALAVLFLVAAAPMRAPNGRVAAVQSDAAPIR